MRETSETHNGIGRERETERERERERERYREKDKLEGNRARQIQTM